MKTPISGMGFVENTIRIMWVLTSPFLAHGQIDVTVATDKTVYDYGEPIEVYVTAYNLSADSLTLWWGDHCQFDYFIDGESNITCIQVPSQVIIPSDSSHTWQWIHTSSLSVGEHEVVGLVVSYGIPDTTYITVAPLGVQEKANLVIPIMHLAAYPNPFNPITTIEFSIPRGGLVTLTMHDLLGKEVETILSQHMDTGHHRVHWNAGDVPSGIYFVRMRSGDFTQVRKVTVLR